MGKIVQNEIVFGRSTSQLSQLADVDLTQAPKDGQALIWDAQMHKWVPGNVGGGLNTNQVRLRITTYTTPEGE